MDDVRKYRQVPPNWVRKRQVNGPQFVLTAVAAHKRPRIAKTRSRIHPRLGAVRHELWELLRVDDPVEAAAVMDDLQTLLVRCGYHLDGQRVQREKKQKSRAQRRRAAVGNVPRGRPAGAMNFALRQLGLGLAMIWSAATGRAPIRSLSWETGHGRGEYFEFVALVLRVIPRQVLRKGKGQVPGSDWLIRQSVADYAQAQASPHEYRRRGLLDEHSGQYWHVPTR